MNLLDKFVGWYLKKKQAKQQAVKKQTEDAKLVEAYKNIRQLYDFVKFLNKEGFHNRAERKQFWNDVKDGKPVVEDVLNRMMQAYGVKSETIKKLEEERIKRLVEKTKEELKEKTQ